MHVQTSNSLFSANGILAPQKGLAAKAPASAATFAASSATTVTISQAARDLAAQPATSPYLEYRASVMRNAENDPAFAKKMAEDFANDDSYEKCGPLLDITAYPTLRYACTGERVTDENLAAFKAEAAKVTEGRIALYREEKAKGTPDVQILEKLFAYVDRQSDDYLSKLGWTRAPQQNAAELRS